MKRALSVRDRLLCALAELAVLRAEDERQRLRHLADGRRDRRGGDREARAAGNSTRSRPSARAPRPRRRPRRRARATATRRVQRLGLGRGCCDVRVSSRRRRPRDGSKRPPAARRWRSRRGAGERAARRAHERPSENGSAGRRPRPRKAARARPYSFARSPPPPQHFSFERESPPPRTPRGRICLRCGGPLQAVGTARANGVTHHDDWEGRAYHKKCWREVKEQQELEQTFAPRPRRITCPGCGNPCSVKTSNSAKNPNRQFYACECKATGMWTTGFVWFAD